MSEQSGIAVIDADEEKPPNPEERVVARFQEVRNNTDIMVRDPLISFGDYSEIPKDIYHNPRYCPYIFGRCRQRMMCSAEQARECSLKKLLDENQDL